LASQAGLSGLVCSAREARALKAAYPALQRVTPGIRAAGSAADDQRRILSPREALAEGADYLVVGRPITGAENPAKTLEQWILQLG